MVPTLPEDPLELGSWVLDHGLPSLRRELNVDETIAIAGWVGDEYALCCSSAGTSTTSRASLPLTRARSGGLP